MSIENRDHQYTITLAEAALEHIKTRQFPGDPPSFEIWYTYAGRFIPALNEAINAAIGPDGKVSATEIDRIYDRFLGTFRLSGQIDAIGEAVRNEVDQIVGTLDAAVGSAERYDRALRDIDKKLDLPEDGAVLRELVVALVRATREAVHESRNYRIKLEATRAEVVRLQGNLDAIRFESHTDALTALVNRKQFDQSLADAVSLAALTSEPLSLAICDVDHFKKINDTWGHPLGDDVLRLIARAIKEVVRRSDIAARYGGEEFAVIFPNTDIQTSASVAERLRQAISEKSIVRRSTGKSLGHVTVSVGVTQWQPGETAREFLERADARLYDAKHRGRNLVVGQPSSEILSSADSDAA